MKIKKEDQNGIIAAVISLCITIIVVAILQSLNISESAVIIALLILPLLVFGVVSGRIQELKGPGGWEAKFKSFAKQSLTVPEEVISLTNEEMYNMPKMSIRQMKEKISRMGKVGPVALTMILGKGDYYRVDALREALHRLLEFKNFKFIIIIDKENHLIAYATAQEVLSHLQYEHQSVESLVNGINSGNKDEILGLPFMNTMAAKQEEGYAAALNLFETLDIDALPVVDKDNTFLGVIKSDKIFTKMLLSLTESTK